MVRYAIDRIGAVEAICRIERHVGSGPGQAWGHASKTPVAVRIGGRILPLPGISAADRKAIDALTEAYSR